MAYDLRRMRAMSNKVAIVGIGDTNYAEDYRRPKEDTLTQRDSYDLGVEAFLKALEDSGLRKEDIDGLGVTSPLGFERVGEILGLKYSWGAEVGGVEQLVHLATEAINSGRCNTVALLYGNAQRSLGTAYGGPSQSQSAYMVLWYFHPWGFSSNGAEYALVFREYFERFGGTEEKLGTVAVTLRKHAMLNENAVMRTPLTINDYMNSRYIARPLHLYDYCIINDGGAALILTRADRAKHLRHTPVLVSGVGRFSDGVRHTQIPFRFMDDCWNNLQYAAEQCFGMAKLGPKDIQHFQTYDGFSVLIPMNLKALAFAKGAKAWTTFKMVGLS